MYHRHGRIISLDTPRQQNNVFEAYQIHSPEWPERGNMNTGGLYCSCPNVHKPQPCYDKPERCISVT